MYNKMRPVAEASSPSHYHQTPILLYCNGPRSLRAFPFTLKAHSIIVQVPLFTCGSTAVAVRSQLIAGAAVALVAFSAGRAVLAADAPSLTDVNVCNNEEKKKNI